jgi:putative transcriptional regulator
LPFEWDFEIIKVMTDKDKSYLVGQLLLAMPSVGDPRFHKAVIFMCAHDSKGGMGIVINCPVPGMTFSKLLEHFDIIPGEGADKMAMNTPVMAGGPVETTRGFLLHSREFVTNDTINVNRDFSVSGTVASLKACATGQGPRKIRFALGYAGWESTQLEQEIQENAWLTVPATEEIVFNTEPELMWERAMAQIGIDPAMLSSVGGHA